MRVIQLFAWTCAAGLLVAAAAQAAAQHGDEPEAPAAEERAPAQPESPAATESLKQVAVPQLPHYRPPEPAKPPGFQPPARGRPEGRVGGGSRGVRSATHPWICALVPEHVARTASAQPSLFWYADGPLDAETPLYFALIEPSHADPIVEVRVPVPQAAGIQRVSLAELGVALQSGIEYEWSIALVVDPEQRSNDLIASGWIDRVEPPAGLAAQLERDGPEASPAVYAEAGLWYDAMTSLADLLDASPGDAGLERSRRALLEQVGLDKVVSVK